MAPDVAVAGAVLPPGSSHALTETTRLETPAGELDIVALRRGVFAFVEVKARRPGGAAGTPEDALTPTKLRRVRRAAEHVLRTRGLPDAPHVLLGAAVDLNTDGRPAAVRFLPVESPR